MEIGFKEVNKNVYSGRLVGLWIKEVTREKMADALLAIAPHIEIIHANCLPVVLPVWEYSHRPS